MLTTSVGSKLKTMTQKNFIGETMKANVHKKKTTNAF